MASTSDRPHSPRPRATPVTQVTGRDAEALHQIAAGEIGLCRTHEILGDERGGIAPVAAHLLGEAPPDLACHMGHVIAADLARPVAHPGMKQQARRLDRTRAKNHGPAALPLVRFTFAVDHGGHPAGRVALEAVDETRRPDLRARRDRAGQVGHVHARLGAVAAALMAGAAADASLSRGRAGCREIVRDDGGRRIGGEDADGRANRPPSQSAGALRDTGEGRSAVWRPKGRASAPTCR